VIGSYPKVAEEAYGTTVIGAINRWQKKALSDQELERVFQDVTQQVIAEQESLGLDIITDGQIRWEDLVTSVVSQWSNIEINGLTRYFNNNVYYRKPIITGKPQRKAQRLVDQFTVARSVVKRATLKAVLPGPYTVAQLAEDRAFRNDGFFLQEIAQLLRQEAEALQHAGATVIQIDEPALAFGQPKSREVLSALHMVVDNVQAAKVLQIYFGPPQLPIEALLDAEIDGVGLDFVEAPQLVETIQRLKWPKDKGLGVGCMDARNTKVERPAALKQLWRRLASVVAPEQLYVSPNCGLEFLPHDRVVTKLTTLVSAAREFAKECLPCS